MSEESEYECVLPFVSDDPQFCLGFEMGRLWEILKQPGLVQTSETLHAINDEQVLLMARRLGFEVTITRLNDEWMECAFAR